MISKKEMLNKYYVLLFLWGFMYHTRVFLFMQLINKFDGLPFSTSDENFVEAFAIFCGMGIHNTRM